ncbi:hypothetical protein BU25DRAFT_439144 [Macroventuria anomochaeta]|uniref:Uncharacterized protein n=1 Tax=Macroventuria anomochaeta TaxID=301207 RepID=A0ACB6S555_9PLEO|nr:uncharacterized protein BU25DRAFT_439144 [Macroventuria anomochaeta]KAF2629178.1 hypothetical protein BU25DRAFT_439144 [Macroventuria anomochaeta]
MPGIHDALMQICQLKPGKNFTYTEIAKIHCVNRVTLSRHHRGVQQSQEDANTDRRLLHPQQELYLVKYIEELTDRHLPLTRQMVANFAFALAHNKVSESWITDFLHRHSDRISSQWTTSMDAQRHAADSLKKYTKYFDILQQKITHPRHTYNMDEKGFAIGLTGKSKRIFSKQTWQQGRSRESLQDGNREWVTLLASVCADGSTCHEDAMSRPFRTRWESKSITTYGI